MMKRGFHILSPFLLIHPVLISMIERVKERDSFFQYSFCYILSRVEPKSNTYEHEHNNSSIYIRAHLSEFFLSSLFILVSPIRNLYSGCVPFLSFSSEVCLLLWLFSTTRKERKDLYYHRRHLLKHMLLFLVHVSHSLELLLFVLKQTETHKLFSDSSQFQECLVVITSITSIRLSLSLSRNYLC